MIIKEQIVPAFFQASNSNTQQCAFLAIAKLSNKHNSLAEFMMGFAKFLHKDINAIDSSRDTALTDAIFDCSKNNFSNETVQRVMFLIHQGADLAYLNRNAAALYQTIQNLPINRMIEQMSKLRVV